MTDKGRPRVLVNISPGEADERRRRLWSEFWRKLMQEVVKNGKHTTD